MNFFACGWDGDFSTVEVGEEGSGVCEDCALSGELENTQKTSRVPRSLRIVPPSASQIIYKDGGKYNRQGPRGVTAAWQSEVGLKPIGAIRDPPGSHSGGNSCSERPPEREREIGEKAESGKRQPEDFALHENSVVDCRATGA